MNKRFFVYLLLIFICSGCDSNKTQPTAKPFQIADIEDDIIEANISMVKDETRDIELLIKRYNWKMNASGTGLHYQILNSKQGNFLKKGDVVTLRYSISLIDGKEIYNSQKNGEKTLTIDQSDEPAGLHELLKYMKKGEHARAIIPSHLAFGILGDNDQIPAYATLIYKIEIIEK